MKTLHKKKTEKIIILIDKNANAYCFMLILYLNQIDRVAVRLNTFIFGLTYVRLWIFHKLKHFICMEKTQNNQTYDSFQLCILVILFHATSIAMKWNKYPP